MIWESEERIVCGLDHVQTGLNQNLNFSDLSDDLFLLAVYTLLGKYGPFMKP